MRRFLGQHFLIDKKKLRKIVEALDLKAGDIVIEIGPGHGELTREIIARLQNCKIKKLIAIEKDEKLAKNLEIKIKNSGLKNIAILKGDALKVLPKLISNYAIPQSCNYKLVGNIPYYITGHLFRIIGELKNKPSLIVFTLQKEVAERISAAPLRRRQGFGGQAGMNLLAASVQFWAEPQIIGYVSKKDFRPQPSVDSAIIKLKTADAFTCESRLKRARGADEEKRYYLLIKTLFKQPRKTILNNLINFWRSDLPKIDVNIRRSDLIKLLNRFGINPGDRPQNLRIEQIKKLSTFF